MYGVDETRFDEMTLDQTPYTANPDRFDGKNHQAKRKYNEGKKSLMLN